MRTLSLFVVLVLVCNLAACEGKVVVNRGGKSVKASKLPKKTFSLTKIQGKIESTSIKPEILGAADSTGGSSSSSAAVINLSKTILGAGALSLSYGIASFTDAKEGVIPGILLLFVMGVISAYSFYSIGRVCDYYSVTSFSAAWERTVGATSKKFLEFILIFKTFFTCLAYSIIIGK